MLVMTKEGESKIYWTTPDDAQNCKYLPNWKILLKETKIGVWKGSHQNSNFDFDAAVLNQAFHRLFHYLDPFPPHPYSR